MRILITGSTGFVGRHLVPLLEEAGHELIHLVRVSKGLAREIIWDFKGPLPNFPPCEAVIHLAADVDFRNEFRIEQYQVNTVSTMHLAAYAKQQQSYFVFASTIGVHGSKATAIDQSSPLCPDNSYAMSKYLAEEAIKTSGINYTILRIAGIYGLDGPAHLGLNTAISNAFHRGEPPTLKGPGKARRNYICVIDVARTIAYLIDQYVQRKQDISPLIYCAGSEVLTIEEYLQNIVKVLLPGKHIVQDAGSNGQDMVVQVLPAPFFHTRFTEYLRSLKN